MGGGAETVQLGELCLLQARVEMYLRFCVQDPRYYVLLEMEKGEDEAEKLVCECLTCTMWTV